MVKSADRVMQILEAIGSSEGGKTHGELSSTLNIPKSSLSLLLANLVDREYLSLRVTDKRYALGPQVLVLAGRYLSTHNVIRLGQPVIRQIMMSTDESALLATRCEGEILIVFKEDCIRPLKGTLEIGDRAPIFATAAGKAILAFQSRHEIEAYLSSVELRPITKTTVTDAEVLRRELMDIKSRGLAYSREEYNEGLVAMASPVFDFYGCAVASIVVIIPTIRFAPERENKIGNILCEASINLSRQLGFNIESNVRDAKIQESDEQRSGGRSYYDPF